MSAAEWLLWVAAAGIVWAVFCASSLPDLCARLAARYRHGGGPR
ncbi:hypothetical protein [Streptomyces sp. SID8352]|nr:hypothetical protein [Streptomyces sp. SID8352]